MRKCSHCGLNGHNSRTCNEKGCVKLFGVNIKRSLSTGDLEGYAAKSSTGHVEQEGYNSDECHYGRERKKGTYALFYFELLFLIELWFD